MSVMTLAQVTMTPDSEGLPGGEVAQGLLNGLLFYGLLACAAGAVLGLIASALFKHFENPGLQARSKGYGLGAFGCAFLLGLTTVAINFAFATGQSVPDSATAAPAVKKVTSTVKKPVTKAPTKTTTTKKTP